MAQTGDHILVHFVEEQPVGYEFEWRRMSWPLHITLIVWFSLPPDVVPAVLDERLEGVAADTVPYILQIGEVEFFGPRRDVPVNPVINQRPVRALHKRLKKELDSLDVRYQSERWTGDRFSAHITQHGDNRTEKGSALKVAGFYLVDLLPQNVCRVVKQYHLGYNA